MIKFDRIGKFSEVHWDAASWLLTPILTSQDDLWSLGADVPDTWLGGASAMRYFEHSLRGFPMVLRKGSKGSEVTELQELLRKHGAALKADGSFGPATERAVRIFQRSNGLAADGIVGSKSLASLRGQPGRSMHSNAADVVRRLHAAGHNIYHAVALPSPGTSRPANQISISDLGLSFLYRREAQKGVSNHLYWPKGASGVTLGAGYDMKERTKDSITADMIAIGLNPETAKKVAEGARKTGVDAENFCKTNRKLVDLTPAQETALLKNVVPQYEAIVRQSLKVHLMQYEYDALVSFGYNPGGRFGRVAHLINEGEVVDAMAEIKKAVTSKGETLPGLVKRRDLEVAFYLTGKAG